jgi:GDP-D-mannose dehydratase
MEEKPRLLITGISGYIGAHVALEAIKSKKYKVRGSIRNKNNPEKQKLLSEAFGENMKHIEIVEADLLNEQSIRSAVKGNFLFSLWLKHKTVSMCFMSPHPFKQVMMKKQSLSRPLKVLVLCLRLVGIIN